MEISRASVPMPMDNSSAQSGLDCTGSLCITLKQLLGTVTPAVDPDSKACLSTLLKGHALFTQNRNSGVSQAVVIKMMHKLFWRFLNTGRFQQQFRGQQLLSTQ